MPRAARLALLSLLAFPLLPLAATTGGAEEVPATGSDFGGAGLIEMRNARFREDGTLEAGVASRHSGASSSSTSRPCPSSRPPSASPTG